MNRIGEKEIALRRCCVLVFRAHFNWGCLLCVPEASRDGLPTVGEASRLTSRKWVPIVSNPLIPGRTAKPKAPLLHRFHQLFIDEFKRFGADTYLAAKWIVHNG
jgi:hypothetical protein